MTSNHKYIVYKEELKLLSLSISNTCNMKMEDIIQGRDHLIIESYNVLTKNFTKSVNRFVVFKDNGRNIEIEHGIGQRSMFIDMLISHFESKEEYEKCKKLLTLRELVIMAGD